jgi:hypothetical protein
MSTTINIYSHHRASMKLAPSFLYNRNLRGRHTLAATWLWRTLLICWWENGEPEAVLELHNAIQAWCEESGRKMAEHPTNDKDRSKL